MIYSVLLMAATPSATVVADTLKRELLLQEAQVTAVGNTATRSSAPTMVVSREDISQRGLTTLAEALRTLPGLNVRDYGGIGGLQTVSLRGFGTQHTALCYDGLYVGNAQNGQTDISRYNLEHLQRIQVEIGGTDDLLRPARLAASAGAVILTTQQPAPSDAATHGEIQLRCASFGTWQPHADVQRRLSPRWTANAWADFLHSRGDYPFTLRNGSLVVEERRLNSRVNNGKGEVNLYGDLQRFGALRIKAYAGASSRQLPGSVVFYTQQPTEHLWQRDATLAALHKMERNRWQTLSSLSYNYTYNRYTDCDAKYVVPEDDRYHLHEVALSSSALWQPAARWSVALAEDIAVTHLRANTSECAFPTRETSHTALSARYRSQRLNVQGTVLGLLSYDQVQQGQAAPHHRHLLPSVSLAFQPLEKYEWRLRLSAKESFRLPTFNDLYYLRVGNHNLRPERAWQLNVGTTFAHVWRRQHLELTADAYHNRVKDKITAIPTLFLWHMRNIGRVMMTGCDVSAGYSHEALTPWLRLAVSANYSLQRALDITDSGAKNYRHQIPYTPRHSGHAVVTFGTPWCNVSYQLTAASVRYSMPQNTAAYRLAPYADHGISVNHTFSLPRRSRLHLSAEALNLAGRNYEVIQYYPMMGRNYRLTAKYGF